MQLFPFFGAKEIIDRINYVVDKSKCTYKSLGPTRFNIEEVKNV